MKTTNTLKGHGQSWYKKQNDNWLNEMVELYENKEGYSKPYIYRQYERVKDNYEQNSVVIEAYNILNTCHA